MSYLSTVLLIPTVCATVCYFLCFRTPRLAGYLSLAGSVSALVILGFLYHQFHTSVVFPVSFGSGFFALNFEVNHIVLVLAFLSALTALISSLISPRGVGSYHYVLIQLSLAAVFAFLFSTSLVYFLLFLELASFLAWRLGDTTPLVKVMVLNDRSLLVRQVGILLLLIGLVLAAKTFGYDVANLGANATGSARFLMLLGILALCGQVPFQTWFHDVGIAMPSAGALINTVLTANLGFYSYVIIFGGEPITGFSIAFASYLALATAIICGGAAVFENDMGRMLGYSTASVVALALLSVFRGGDFGLAMGLLLIVVNSLIKMGFFAFMAINDSLGLKRDFRFMGGYGKSFPWVVVGAILLSLALTPFSPLIGFFAYSLFAVNLAWVGSTWMVVLIMGVLVLYCANSLRIVYFISFGARSESQVEGRMVASRVLAFSLCVLFLLLFSLGAVLYPRLIYSIVG